MNPPHTTPTSRLHRTSMDHVVSPATPAASSQHGTSDEVILGDFGISANDEVRRAVQLEIKELEESSKSVSKQAHLQEQRHGEIHKNLVRAQEQVTNGRRGATEVLEMVKMNQQILNGMETSFQIDIMEEHKDKVDAPAHDGERQRATLEAPPTSDTTLPAENLPPAAPTLFEPFLERMNSNRLATAQEFAKSRIALQQGQAHLESLCAKRAALRNKLAAVQHAEKQDGLVESQQRLKLSRQEASTVLQQERNRHVTLKSKLESAKLRLAEKTKEADAMANSLEQLKKQNAAWETNMAKIKEAQKAERTAKAKVLAELQEQEGNLEKELETARASLAQAADLIASREAAKSKREAVRIERLQLVQSKAALERELAPAKRESETLLAKIGNLEEEAAIWEKDKASIVEPDEAALAKLNGEIGTLREDISSEEGKSDVQQGRNALAKAEEEKAQADKEVEAVQARIKETEAEVEKLRRASDDHKDSHKRKLKFLQDAKASVAKKLEDARERQARMKTILRKQALEKEHDALARKAQILRYGAEMLKEAAKTEENLLDLESDSP